MFALGQTKKKKTEETKVRETKSQLKDVVITETVEKSIRNEQHNREQKWKATGRDQIKKNTNFDMARSLFGGGTPTASDEPIRQPARSREPEEEEEVEEEEVEEDVEEEVHDDEDEEEDR